MNPDDTVAAVRLLVSVANAADAAAALAGGADFIDAKDPRTGALGAVSLGVLQEIRATVGTARPVTAAAKLYLGPNSHGQFNFRQ